MAEKITSEQATEALARTPDMRGKLLRFFQALEAGRLPEYYLENFRAYRSEYLDDLPEVDVRDIIDLDISERMARGEDPGSMCRFKCQTNFLAMIAVEMRQMLAQEVVEDASIAEVVRQFYTSGMSFEIGDAENPAKIAEINNVLDLLIGYFEGNIDEGNIDAIE